MAQLKTGSTVGGKVIAIQDDLDILEAALVTKADSDDVALKMLTGGTYYVNPATGNNSNPGTSDLPWASLNAAATKYNNSIITGTVNIFLSAGTVTTSSFSFVNITTHLPFYIIGTLLDFDDPGYDAAAPVIAHSIYFLNCRGGTTYGSYTGTGAEGFPGSPTDKVFAVFGCKVTNTLTNFNSPLGVTKCLFKGSAAGGSAENAIRTAFSGYLSVENSCQFDGFNVVFTVRSSTAYIKGCTGTTNTTGVIAQAGAVVLNQATSSLTASTANDANSGIIFTSPQVVS